MSESLQSSWPSEAAPFEDHVKQLHAGIDEINSVLLLSPDKRFDKALALLTTGRGTKSGVESIGDPATGKTAWGKLVFGADQLVDIAPDDVSDTLYGYTNPTNAHERIAGKLVGLDNDILTLFLNEAGNLDNVRPLLNLWDDESIRHAAVYLTTNFPEGSENVHEHDEALVSRVAMQILTGDLSEAKTVSLHGYNAVQDKDDTKTPILPPAIVRAAMHKAVEARYLVTPTSGEETGKYITTLLHALNRSGLTTHVSPTDARISQAFYDSARASMLIDKVEYGSTIEPRHIAEIASLVLPKMVKLNNNARERFVDAEGRRPSNLEKAVGVRRVIARQAFTTLQENEVKYSAQKDKFTADAMNKYSYASPDALAVDIDRALLAGGNGQAETTPKETKDVRRGFFNRRSK